MIGQVLPAVIADQVKRRKTILLGARIDVDGVTLDGARINGSEPFEQTRKGRARPVCGFLKQIDPVAERCRKLLIRGSELVVTYIV